VANPAAIAVAPSSDFLYVAYANAPGGCGSSGSKAACVAAYSYSSYYGVITALNNEQPTGSAPPTGAAIDSGGRFLYVVDNGAIYVLDISSGTGAMTPTSQAASTPFTSAAGARRIAVAPNSEFAYVAAGTNGIVPLAINSANGTLSVLSGGAGSGSGYFVDVKVDPTGSYVYGLDASNAELHAYTIGSGGTLSEVSGSPVSTGGTPAGVAVSPSALNVYVVNSADQTVSIYAVGSGGALSGQATIGTGAAYPQFVVVTQ
jgi:6-phosphogluconolactonase (cycloisomerase 2 family)